MSSEPTIPSFFIHDHKRYNLIGPNKGREIYEFGVDGTNLRASWKPDKNDFKCYTIIEHNGKEFVYLNANFGDACIFGAGNDRILVNPETNDVLFEYKIKKDVLPIPKS